VDDADADDDDADDEDAACILFLFVGHEFAQRALALARALQQQSCSVERAPAGVARRACTK